MRWVRVRVRKVSKVKQSVKLDPNLHINSVAMCKSTECKTVKQTIAIHNFPVKVISKVQQNTLNRPLPGRYTVKLLHSRNDVKNAGENLGSAGNKLG